MLSGYLFIRKPVQHFYRHGHSSQKFLLQANNLNNLFSAIQSNQVQQIVFTYLHSLARKAFSNIFELLREGGDCLLVFMGHLPVFDVYRIMSLDRKWSRWVRDVEKYISPYHDSQVKHRSRNTGESRLLQSAAGWFYRWTPCHTKIFFYQPRVTDTGIDSYFRRIR